MIGYYSSEFLS